jgi:RNA polymerase sigma-70 factor, ECF subfamily
VRNKEEAEEAVSEVFFQLWKNRNHLIIEHNVKAYLYVSVKNASLAIIRLRQPFFEDIDDVLTAANLTDHAHPEKIIEFHELRDHFQQAVDQLPARCRQVFVLNRFDSLKYKEISDLLGISEKTVEHQIAKALSILRESLHRYLRV